jgi:hypothetical protein
MHLLYVTASVKLQKVQRLACPSTFALEAILDLPPLLDLVKKEAAQSAFMMLDSHKSNTGDMGNTGTYEDLQSLQKYNGPASYVRLTTDNKVRLQCSISEQVPTEQRFLTDELYSDGLREDDLGDIGGLSLNNHNFLAEMFTINVCARKCTDMKAIDGKHVNIMSDSQVT